MTKFRWSDISAQHITIIGSLFVSACALVASTVQVFIMREQSTIMLEQQKLMTEQYKASLWARVECTFFYQTNPEYFKIVVRNAGTGPALVQGVRVTYDNKIYQRWTDLFEAVADAARDTFNVSIMRIHGRTLVPGEEVTMMGNGHPRLARVIGTNDKLRVEVCYQSVYGSNYLHTRKSQNGSAVLDTQEVKACSIPEREQLR